MSSKGAPGTKVVSWGDESSEPQSKCNHNSSSFALLPTPFFAPNKQLLSLWLQLASKGDRQSQHQVIKSLKFCHLNIPSQMEMKQCGGKEEPYI